MKPFPFLLLALCCGLTQAMPAEETKGDQAGEPGGVGDAADFRSVDLYLDSAAKPLAAYQVEVSARSGNVRFAGIEGGAHPAFQSPPFYDPQAMRQERLILAAYNTSPAKQLPTGKFRVATLHYQIPANQTAEFAVTVMAAGTVDGKPIPLLTSLEERKTK